MLPTANIGIGALSLPQLPPVPSGPSPVGPAAFGRMYDRLMTNEQRQGLPTQMEVAPIMLPATDLSQPFRPSVEFPGAVSPDGLKVPGAGATAESGNHLNTLLKPFQDSLAQVNQLSHDSVKLANEAAVGGDVDLHDVMIAGEKASVAVQLTVQVRNKLVEAYQEVMRMQV